MSSPPRGKSRIRSAALLQVIGRHRHRPKWGRGVSRTPYSTLGWVECPFVKLNYWRPVRMPLFSLPHVVWLSWRAPRLRRIDG